MSDINYSDIETKGFIVVQNVLDQKSIDQLLADYKESKRLFESRGTSNKNYNMLVGCTVQKTAHILAPVLDKINDVTDSKIDTVVGRASYFDSKLLQFGWHQDHEPYYMWQLAKNYVNFWIPLIKPNRSVGGLRLIPFDKLRESVSDVFVDNYVIDHGAQNFYSSKKKTTIENSDAGTTIDMDVDLDKICVIPDCGPGDAIVMRGDLIHETHKTGEYRVAASIKVFRSNHAVTRAKFFTNSESKQKTIAQNPLDYAYHLQKFNIEKAESFPLRDLFPKAPLHYSLARPY